LRASAWTWSPNRSIKELRVLCIPGDDFSTPARATTQTVESAAKVLKDAGLRVESTIPPFFSSGIDRWVFNQIPDQAVAIREFRRQYSQLGSPATEHHYQVEWLLRMIDAWAPQFDEARRMDEKLKLEQFRQDMVAATESYDAILVPVSNKPAGQPVTAEQYEKLTIADYDQLKSEGFFALHFNLMGWPAVVVRCGTSDEGLPIGLQVAAKPWREDIALSVALVLEKELGGWSPPIN
jgi:amidase